MIGTDNGCEQCFCFFMRACANQARCKTAQCGVIECSQAIAYDEDAAGMHAEFAQAKREQQGSKVFVAANFAAEANGFAGTAAGGDDV